MATKEEPVNEEKTASLQKEENQEEKEKLMAEILELQNTLHDLSQRVHSVKEENEQLKTDNQVTVIHVHVLLKYQFLVL